MIAHDVLDFYKTMSDVGVEVWIDGGWGVDALLGKQTRQHKDLDIAIEEKHVALLRDVLLVRGFREVRLEDARPWNFVLGDETGKEIDVHVIVLDDTGNGVYGPPEKGEMYPAASLTGSGIIDGQKVRCISPEWAVRFHSGRIKEFARVNFMAPIDEILKLDPLLFDANWKQIEQVIWSLQTVEEQIAAWEAIADRLRPHPVSKGMPFFRLGHMYLVSDSDAKRAIENLEKAYREDMKYGPDQGKTPNRMGAYRLLALSKGFIEYLEGKKNWEAEQLQQAHRPVLMRTLLAVYDASLAHIMDSEVHTYQSFFAVIQDKSLVRFAIENYFFAERLIEMFYVSGTHLSRHTDEYGACQRL